MATIIFAFDSSETINHHFQMIIDKQTKKNDQFSSFKFGLHSQF